MTREYPCVTQRWSSSSCGTTKPKAMTNPSKAALIAPVNKVQRDSVKAQIIYRITKYGPMDAEKIAQWCGITKHVALKRISDLCDLGLLYAKDEQNKLTIWAIPESAEQKFHAYQKRHEQKYLAFLKRGLKEFYADLSPEVIADFEKKLSPILKQ